MGNTTVQGEQEENSTMLQGGIYYCHYSEQAENNDNEDTTCRNLNKENTDFYVEDEQDEEQGYVGDSLEAAAENKRKMEEEQKKKANEQMQQARQAQQTQHKTSSQMSSTNQKWILPVSKGHKVTRKFGKRIPPAPGASNFHDGIDINAVANTPVYAVANGKVCVAGWVKGYGNYIEIDLGNNMHSFYGHLNKINVTKNMEVKQGQVIGLSGNTGVGTGPHLHFGVHIKGDRKDPTIYLPNF